MAGSNGVDGPGIRDASEGGKWGAMNEEKLSSLQAALGAEGLDGWLYDFRGSDPIGRSILRAERLC